MKFCIVAKFQTLWVHKTNSLSYLLLFLRRFLFSDKGRRYVCVCIKKILKIIMHSLLYEYNAIYVLSECTIILVSMYVHPYVCVSLNNVVILKKKLLLFMPWTLRIFYTINVTSRSDAIIIRFTYHRVL